MGVTGLWQIIDAVGHPIKLEGLEGKRLGVDANIWLYKFIRGFREKDNASVNIESHKLGLFNRICKLLYYRIKPVFVFDGPAPILKRRTLEKRQNVRSKQVQKTQDAAMKLLAQQLKEQYPDINIDSVKVQMPNLTSHNLVAAEKLTDEDRELFYLPPQVRREDIVSDHEDDDDDLFTPTYIGTQSQKVDIHSSDFDALTPEIRYEILKDIKETNKRIRGSNYLPEDSESFSKFQLQRLKSRRTIQEKIEQAERDICSAYTGDCDVLVFHRENQTTDIKTVHTQMTDRLPTGNPQTTPAQTSITYDNAQQKRTQTTDIKRATNRITTEVVVKGHSPDLISHHPDATEKLTDHDLDLSHSPPQVRSEDIVIDDDDDSDDDDVLFTSAYIGSQRVDIHSSDSESVVEEFEECHPDLKLQNPVAAEISTDESRDSSPPHTQVRCEDIVIDHKDDDDNISSSACIGTQSQNVDYTHLRKSDALSPELHHEVSEDIKETDEKIRKSNCLQEVSTTAPEFQPQRLKSRRIDEEKIEQEELDNCSPPNGDALVSKSKPVKTNQNINIDDQSALTQIIHPSPTNTDQTTDHPPTSRPKTIPAQASLPPDVIQQMRAQTSDVKRVTNRVTTKVVEEAKELLKLFGIPYIEAEGEAEAQCALLESLKLTDGTITDDSDIWLFGAQNVYRHFFSDDKHVLQYKMIDIEFHIRMTRSDLVCFAMLVGSDYTEGIRNIGPVTALEVLSEFPGGEMEPLEKFKAWRTKFSLKKGQIACSKKRKGLLKFLLPEDFPSKTVFDGYMRPVADTSTEKFTWGVPELDELREYARRNFGWDSKKIDEKLLPVMKRLSEKKTQTTIDTFFFKRPVNQNPELFRSKRVNQALEKKAQKHMPDVVQLSDSDSDD